MCLIFKSTSLRKNSILSTRVRHVPHSKILVQKYKDYLTRLRHVPHLQNNKFKKKINFVNKGEACTSLSNHKFTKKLDLKDEA